MGHSATGSYVGLRRHDDLNALAARVHRANQKWWVSLETGEPIERNRMELLSLMHSEASECLEGERKGLFDDHIPTRRMAEVEMADIVIRALDYAGGFNIHLYDARGEFGDPEWSTLLHWSRFNAQSNRGEMIFAIHRLINGAADELARPSPQLISRVIAGCRIYCDILGYDLWGAFEDKMAYNEARPDHKREARLADGGKKW